MKIMHTLRSLQNDLEKAGIRPSDTVIIHSSMKKIGLVEGGADTVIDAFLDYFGDKGLVVFPTLTYTLAHLRDDASPRCDYCLKHNKPSYCLASEWQGRKPEFHVNTTPACIGLLPNLFRVRPGVFRSLNATHSVAAFGKDAREFTAGHENGDTPCGKHSPWWKLYLRNAKVLHLGSRVSNTTFMHGVDEWSRSPDNLQGYLEQQIDVYDQNERLVKQPIQHNTSGSSGRFPWLSPCFKAAAAQRSFQFGDIQDAIVLDCRTITDLTLKALKVAPTIFR